MNKKFKDLAFEKRLIESQRMREKYPDRVPIIVDKNSNSDLPDIDKYKFLVPNDINIGQFLHTIRKRINLQPERALFIFIKNTLPPTSALISNIYDNHKDEDGFLYITYTGENTFGYKNINVI